MAVLLHGLDLSVAGLLRINDSSGGEEPPDGQQVFRFVGAGSGWLIQRTQPPRSFQPEPPLSYQQRQSAGMNVAGWLLNEPVFPFTVLWIEIRC